MGSEIPDFSDRTIGPDAGQFGENHHPRMESKTERLDLMTDTTQPGATAIAQAILDMKFADMITVMNAINQATGAKRNRVDGVSMLKAAQLIIDDKVNPDGEPDNVPKPPKPKS